MAVVQEVVRLVPRARVQQQIDEQLVKVPSPQVFEEIAEVRSVPRTRVQRIDEQLVEVPFATHYGRHCGRVQGCTMGAIFGKDL